jgi:hypothetical protein
MELCLDHRHFAPDPLRRVTFGLPVIQPERRLDTSNAGIGRITPHRQYALPFRASVLPLAIELLRMRPDAAKGPLGSLAALQTSPVMALVKVAFP